MISNTLLYSVCPGGQLPASNVSSNIYIWWLGVANKLSNNNNLTQASLTLQANVTRPTEAQAKHTGF